MNATRSLCALKCEHLGTDLVFTGEVWCLQSHGKAIMAICGYELEGHCEICAASFWCGCSL